MAQHKEDFWRATDADGQPINYAQVINGELRLVPTDFTLDFALSGSIAALPVA